MGSRRDILCRLPRSCQTAGTGLQEDRKLLSASAVLLAPRQVHFYDAKWQPIGSRGADADIASVVHRASGIEVEELINFWSGRSKTSVAQRLSWAARRNTTREEDRAYCLLGIFRVNMPLLYGEGFRAFQRLLTRIYAQTGDESKFASSDWTKALATRPSYFRDCSNIVPMGMVRRPPISITDRALEYDGPVTEFLLRRPLSCITDRALDYDDPATFLLQSRFYLVKLNCVKYCKACASPANICAVHAPVSGQIPATSFSLLLEELPGPEAGICRIAGHMEDLTVKTTHDLSDIGQRLSDAARRECRSARLQILLSPPARGGQLLTGGDTSLDSSRYSLDQHDTGAFYTSAMPIRDRPYNGGVSLIERW